MGLSFIDNKKWSEITRDERFFCSHLYHSIIGKEIEFINFLNKKLNLNLNSKDDWEINYEVCFYRDILHYWNNHNRKIDYPWVFSPKRTYDLCLLSNENIVIIEAKAQQSFSSEQLSELKRDKENVEKLMETQRYKVNVHLILLHSSRYQPRNDMHKITWLDIYKEYNKNEIFKRANSIYRD